MQMRRPFKLEYDVCIFYIIKSRIKITIYYIITFIYLK